MTSVIQESRSARYEFSLSTKEGSKPSISYNYPIYVRSQPDWEEFAALLADVRADHFTLVADSGLPHDLVTHIYQRVCALGVPCLLLPLRPNEKAKTMQTALDIAYQARADGGGTHSSCLITLGGGLIGNITGLAAHLMVRGVKLIHIPTTLLAATDSVLSCKQGVNGDMSSGLLVKNLLGAFKAPELVLVYLSFWETLDADEIRSGLCELVKNVLAIHPHRYQDAYHRLNPEAHYTPQDYAHFFTWCFEAKNEVMQHDAHEQGSALVLEYGHTVGHALESLTGLKHGLAIAEGMLVSAHIASARGYLRSEEVAKHYHLLSRNGVQVTLPASRSNELLELIRNDNKIGYLPRIAGAHAMVILEHLGKPIICDSYPLTYVSDEEIRAGIAALESDISQQDTDLPNSFTLSQSCCG